MQKLRQFLSDALSAFGRLSPRERNLVALTGTLVIAFVVAIAALQVSRTVSRREARIRGKLGQLDEVAKLTSGYRAAETQRNELEARLRGNQVRLFSYLDELAKRQGLEIGGMNDKGTQPAGGEGSRISESAVEVTFTRIGLDKLVKFLAEVEATQGLVKVTRLQIRPRGDEPVLDAWLVVTTYQLAS